MVVWNHSTQGLVVYVNIPTWDILPSAPEVVPFSAAFQRIDICTKFGGEHQTGSEAGLGVKVGSDFAIRVSRADIGRSHEES